MSQTANSTEPPPLPSPTRRNWVWFSFQCILGLFFLIWFRYRARGVERIPKTGGGLFLINHQSFLDPLLVGMPLSRPVSYLARDSLFKVPFIGWVLRKTYVMPINRDSSGTGPIKEGVRRIKHGFLVGIFPEGTRSRDGAVGQLKPGFVTFIRRTKSPVFPVGIAGADKAFPRSSWFIKPRRIRIVFGAPFSPEELDQLSQRGREHELVALAHERISQCQREAEEWRQQ